MINDPAIVIADEPTAHLDTALSTEFLNIAEDLAADDKTLLIASHDPLVFEAGVVDRVIEMCDGKIMQAESSKVKAESSGS